MTQHPGFEPTCATQILQLRLPTKLILPVLALISTGWLGAVTAQTPGADATNGYSNWDVQILHGSQFNEPFNPNSVAKNTVTFRNSSRWSWGSSYFFVDTVRSDSNDQNATEVYAKWYPSASLSKLTGTSLSAGWLRDVSATLGLNAGTKSTGAAPFAFLPGVTLHLKLPGFDFFSLGTYAYIDRGHLNGTSNGCHNATYQVTPSWSLPFEFGAAKFNFDGFIDFIGSHGDCVRQILAQPQLKLDIGSFFAKPNKISMGIKWQYWDSKFGIKDLNENFPQIVVQWTF
jgi:nucleoside-specific outer membrane channel protein Tsx